MQLSYQIFGKGPEPLLAFHGIGQTGGECFRSFEGHLGEYYTIYAFDLPFHGKSKVLFENQRWKNGETPITSQEWCLYLTSFLREKEISNFSIAGFSLGGRFALEALECFFQRVNKAFLIAPDGIKIQFMYRLATETRLFRSVFHWVMKNPGLLRMVATGLNNMNLFSSSVLSILRHLTSTPEHAQQVFLSWVNFRAMKAKPGLFARPSDKLAQKVFLLLGKHDPLITEKVVAPLAEKLPQANVIQLNAGHISCLEKAVPAIKRLTSV